MTAFAKLTYDQIKDNAKNWTAVELIAIGHESGFSRDWALTQIVTIRQAKDYAQIKGYSERWVQRWNKK